MSNKEKEFSEYALSDINVIELLVTTRDSVENMSSSKFTNMTSDFSGGINEELRITYIILDDIIEKSKLSDTQRRILEMTSQGYSQDEIAYEVEMPHSRVSSRLKTIYKEIKKENDRHWRNHVYKNKIGLKTKICSKCKVEWAATAEFYSTDSRNSDGLQGRCRKCKR